MNTITATAAGQQAAGLSPGAGVGLGIGAVALIAGLALAMHHRKKSPRVIGWLCFLIGIPLAGLMSGLLGSLAGLSLLALPVSLLLTGYVGFVFLHDGIGKKGKPHRWLQPLFGLLLPALLLTLGGSVGHGVRTVLQDIEGGVGSAVTQTTGQ
jgi:hypothetical protein